MVTMSNFDMNNARGSGGALFVTKADVAIESSTVTGCTSSNGGAIAITGAAAMMTINETDFLNNSARTAGGAIFAESAGSVQIENARFDRQRINYETESTICLTIEVGSIQTFIKIRTQNIHHDKLLI